MRGTVKYHPRIIFGGSFRRREGGGEERAAKRAILEHISGILWDSHEKLGSFGRATLDFWRPSKSGIPTVRDSLKILIRDAQSIAGSGLANIVEYFCLMFNGNEIDSKGGAPVFRQKTSNNSQCSQLLFFAYIGNVAKFTSDCAPIVSPQHFIWKRLTLSFPDWRLSGYRWLDLDDGLI